MELNSMSMNITMAVQKTQIFEMENGRLLI